MDSMSVKYGSDGWRDRTQEAERGYVHLFLRYVNYPLFSGKRRDIDVALTLRWLAFPFMVK